LRAATIKIAMHADIQMTGVASCKWSVEAFYGSIRHSLTEGEVPARFPVELIEGRIVPLPVGDQLSRQVERLRQQLQQRLAQIGYKGLEVRSHYPIPINPYSELRPTLAVISTQRPTPHVHWVIEIDKAEIEYSTDQNLRSHLYAQKDIGEYWALSTQQVELRTHHTPKAIADSTLCGQSEQAQSRQMQSMRYHHQQLRHVGEQAPPVEFPELKMQMQEPLPLYFLTRTATGCRTYVETMLPLKVQH